MNTLHRKLIAQSIVPSQWNRRNLRAEWQEGAGADGAGNAVGRFLRDRYNDLRAVVEGGIVRGLEMAREGVLGG